VRTLDGLKEFVHYLDGLGEIKRVTTPVDPRYEIAAVLDNLGKNDGPAILFEQVKGYAMPLVGNLLGTQKRLALALGIEEDDMFQGLQPRLDKRITPYLLTEENERVIFSLNKDSALQELIPVLTHYVHDSGPYITAGLTSCRDPRTGSMGRGLHRLEIRGNAEIGISLVNPPLSEIYAFHKKQGTRMEVAVAVGVDPAILIGTVLKVPKGIDKLASVGGLTGAAVPTVKAATVDVEIPAYAEIVMEGYIDPTEAEKNGVLGEVSGYYMSFPSPTIHVQTVSMRREAIYHGLLPRGSEVDHLLVLVYGLNVIPKMKKEFPSLLDIHFVPGTFGSHAVMAMGSDDKGEIRRAAAMALTFPNIKKAVIVNEDVNIRDPLEVEWAMATRFQADKDLMVIPALKGQPIDPSSGHGFLTAKMGIDATRPRPEGFEKIFFPDDVQERLPTIITKLKKRN
jgi:2,5-furandicarboxylate decarboxylase 1